MRKKSGISIKFLKLLPQDHIVKVYFTGMMAVWVKLSYEKFVPFHQLGLKEEPVIFFFLPFFRKTMSILGKKYEVVISDICIDRLPRHVWGIIMIQHLI